MFKNLLPPTTHRVKMHTNKKVNQKIKEKTLNSMDIYSTRGTNEISDRIDALNREWDIERTLEANAAALMLIGSTLGLITRKKRWSVLTGVVGGFLLQHAIQGWCPPIPVFRRMYIRTSSEIDSEKYYLKYIRGDFKKWSDK